MSSAPPAPPSSPARRTPPDLPAPRTPPAHSTPHAGQAVALASFGIPSGPGPAGTHPPPCRRAAGARSLPCTRPHVWQTSAIAILPTRVRTFDANTVADNPTVSALCSRQVLLASRRGAARQLPAGSWQIAVLPPDEAAFDGGARAYRCLAARSSGAESSTSQFGQQADQGGRAEDGGGGGRGRGKNG